MQFKTPWLGQYDWFALTVKSCRSMVALACLLMGGLAPLAAQPPQDVAFKAAFDQSEQRYVLLLPDSFDAARPHDLLICLHGHGADRWQFVREDRGETRAARDVAAKYNLILISPDYRAPASWMGPAAEADLIQIIGEVKKQFRIRKLVLSGGSMGATSALTFTALHPDLIDGVVALNGHANHIAYEQFQEAIRASFGGDKSAVPGEYRKRSAEFYPEKITMPIAATAGGKDTVVPPDSIQRLIQSVKKHNPAVYLDFKEGRSHETDHADSLAAFNFVAEAIAPKPARYSVTMNGKTILPSAGSASGIWFYSDGENSAQLLLAGHTSVPDSWHITASLRAGDEVRLSFAPDAADSLANIQFHADRISGTALRCTSNGNGIVIKAGTEPGAAQLTGLRWNDQPAFFEPVRRPFSHEPVMPSPELHPAIADALVEWDWRMQDGILTPREARSYRQAIENQIKHLENLVSDRAKTLPPDDLAAWKKLQEIGYNDKASGGADNSAESLWLQLHRLRRKIALSNPLLGESPLVFVKHVPSVMSHQLTQVYGYCSRPGGGLFVLSKPRAGMNVRNITPANLPAGNFMTPELSYDAQKLLFAYCPVKEAPAAWNYDEKTSRLRYHIHELPLASDTARALTAGDTDNFFPVYLPSGDILFSSTLRGGYHRCGRGPCFVYTLARMGADGQNPHSISFHETHEWDPCLLNDGRVIYTRWDYVDRNAVHYQQLWSARPDGSNVRIFYGNNTWNPAGTWEARAIPGSSRIMATASPHHGMSAGSIIMLDTSKGVDGQEPLTRLTPDVRFPESESSLAFGPSPTFFDFDTPVATYWNSPLKESWMEKTPTEEERRWPGHCYKSPWPLSEKYFLVSYSFDRLVGEPGPNIPNMFGIYLADAFGNKELLYRDPAISSLWARPLARRIPPPDVTTTVSAGNKETGTYFLSDVMQSWPTLPAKTRVAQLRIIQVLLKTTPNADSPRVGAAFAAPGKQVLGTVPVETDGSAFFEVPARTPVLFQALDEKGRALQTMRSLVYLQPGENESCIGCHEHRMKQSSPRLQALALQRAPSRIKPGPDGSLPFSYPLMVQPVLDRHCVKCHDGKEAKRPVLTSEPDGDFTKSYNALVSRVSFSAWNRPDNNFEPLTEPLRFGALGSSLVKMLESGHNEVELSPEEWERLYTWIDSNALFYGTFDVDEQKKQRTGQRIAGPAR